MTTRTIYLVRHGQQDTGSRHEVYGGGLSETGLAQARAVARRLCLLPVAALHTSSLHRAAQTAEIIAAALTDVRPQATELLWECIPAIPPELAARFSQFTPEELARDQARAGQAYDRFFTRPGESDSHEIIVCHGNLIRYFVCRALGVSPTVWAGLEICNGGLTVIRLSDDGLIRVVSHNDVGHLPPSLQTYV